MSNELMPIETALGKIYGPNQERYAKDMRQPIHDAVQGMVNAVTDAEGRVATAVANADDAVRRNNQAVGNAIQAANNARDEARQAAEAATSAAATAGNAARLIAEEFDETKAYSAGDYVTHGGNLYVFNTDHEAGEWNASEVLQVLFGNEVSGLKNALNDNFDEITQPSRNLWPFGDSGTFTRYKYYKPGSVILPAGSYVASAVVSSDGGGTHARIRFDNEDGEEITYKPIEITDTRKASSIINLSEDCYAIWLFSQNNSSASVGVSASWINIQIERGNTASDYVPYVSARDTVLEKSIEDMQYTIDSKMYGSEHLLPNAVGVESLDFLEIGANLFNYDDPKNSSGYVNQLGKVSANNAWKASWYIEVEPSTTYYVGGVFSNSSYKNLNFVCELDEDLNPVNYISSMISDFFTTQATTKYVRVSYGAGITKNRVYLGKTDWDGLNAPEYAPKIPSKMLEIDSDWGEIESRLEILENAIDTNIYEKQYSIFGNMTDGTYLKSEEMANSIRHNERIVFSADITSFNGLEIGFAWFSTSYKYNRFVIDGTNLTVYNYNGNTDITAHGLPLANNIQVIVESSFMRTCNITIISNGHLFKAEGKALDRRRIAFLYAQSVGSVLSNAKLSWTCTDFNKDIWIFGDSYVASYTDKWVKYLYQYGYDKNCLFDAFPGEDSSESIESLRMLLTLAKPKTIIWCLGMNDGSDDNAPTSKWLTAQTELRAICQENNIQLLLATIPTVPNINHEHKNANVRASGYRYIDFANAVGADTYGHWYGYGTATDMLSQDEVHPSDYGAKALFGRVLLDAPEVMITH